MMQTSYDPTLVVLSVGVAVIASFKALDLVGGRQRHREARALPVPARPKGLAGKPQDAEMPAA